MSRRERSAEKRSPMAQLLRRQSGGESRPRIACAEMDPREMTPGDGLFAVEAADIARAVDKRRREYSAGRRLARQAMAELGQQAVALPADGDRVPRWPDDLVGCITHTDRWCAVVVARTSECNAIGIDVEKHAPLEAALWERVCRPEEREWLARQDSTTAGVLAKGLFSAKESLYKALFPRVREFLEFQSVALDLEATDERHTLSWHATLKRAWGAFEPGARIGPGSLRLDDDLVLSSLVLTPER